MIAYRCPVCAMPLQREGNSLSCDAQHTYDFARQGHVNLLARQASGLYEDKALFVSRRAVYRAGFFAPMVDAVREKMPGGGIALDAGCGEGSLLRGVLPDGCQGVGIDIAKAAVAMAAGSYKGLQWCVADLCALPFDDHIADVILNVLTPANYGEFARVLKPSGRLIKVIPGADHLSEIRALLKKARQSGDSDAEAVFLRHVSLEARVRLRYTIPCDAALFMDVCAMTPLTAGTPLPPAQALPVTVDVTILSGGIR